MKEDSDNGRIPYGALPKALDRLKSYNITITVRTLNVRVEKLEKGKRKVFSTRLDPPNSTQALTLSSLTTSYEETASNENEKHARTDITEDEIFNITPVTNVRNAGRKQGTTVANMAKDKTNEIACLDNITTNYWRKRKESGTNALPRGYLRELIAEKKEEFGVDTTISENTIRTRFKRHVKSGAISPRSVTQKGLTTVLAKEEEAFVEILIQMVQIRSPVIVSESINLMNLLIKGTEGQKRYIAFQKKYCGMTDDNPKLGLVGEGYFRLFRARHKDRLGASIVTIQNK